MDGKMLVRKKGYVVVVVTWDLRKTRLNSSFVVDILYYLG